MPGGLIDYRWVYNHQEETNDPRDTPVRKALRALMKKDLGKFLTEKGRLEAAFMASKPVAEKKGDEELVKEDEGTERVLEHLGRVLGEYKDGTAEQDSGRAVSAGVSAGAGQDEMQLGNNAAG